MKPEAVIRTARDNFFFAALQWAAMENGRFKYTDLPTGFNWSIEGEQRFFKWEARTESGFQIWVTNQLRAAFAIAAIQVDTVLADYFKNKPYEDVDPERRAARCAMHMIRCAFAHNPLEPIWEVRNPQYCDVFSVPSCQFKLDTRKLDARPFDEAQLNWFSFLDLIDYCHSLAQ